MHLIYIALLVLAVVQFSRQNLQSKNRIYKGTIAEPHSAPYQVALIVVRKNNSRLCGGSLIKPQFVLTAAHCIENADSIKVIIGTNSLANVLKIKTDVEVISNRIHELWNSRNLYNDIGILGLRSPVELNDKIAIVRLPKKPDKSSLVGKYGKVTGWGRTSAKPTKRNTILMELKVRIVGNEECSQFRMTSTKLCGYGDDNGSPCQGDSGGPLVLDNTYIQIGIISHGSKKGFTLGYPHVYTNVASYLDWINKWTASG